MEVEDYINIIDKFDVNRQKDWIISLKISGLFEGNEGVFYGMLRRLERGEKLTPSQIKWIYYKQKEKQKTLQEGLSEELSEFFGLQK